MARGLLPEAYASEGACTARVKNRHVTGPPRRTVAPAGCGTVGGTAFPAGRRRRPVRCGPTVLKKGTAVSFGVNYPLDTTGGSGVRVTGLVVTPPDETKSVTLTWPGAATLPVTDGAGSPIKVGPIGSAGQGG